MMTLTVKNRLRAVLPYTVSYSIANVKNIKEPKFWFSIKM